MELTPAAIEKMRAIGLRLDKEGTFWQEGAPVTHARLREALLRWLDVRDDGRDIVQLDHASGDRPAEGTGRYAYVDVEDAHWRARSARWDGDRCVMSWDSGREAELEYGSLRQAADHALYARIGRLRGRIAGPAYHAVAERIAERGDGFVLVAAGREWPIAGAA